MAFILVDRACRENYRAVGEVMGKGGHFLTNEKEIYGEHPTSLFKQMWSCLHAMPATATALPLNMSSHQHMWQRRQRDS